MGFDSCPGWSCSNTDCTAGWSESLTTQPASPGTRALAQQHVAVLAHQDADGDVARADIPGIGQLTTSVVTQAR